MEPIWKRVQATVRGTPFRRSRGGRVHPLDVLGEGRKEADTRLPEGGGGIHHSAVFWLRHRIGETRDMLRR